MEETKEAGQTPDITGSEVLNEVRRFLGRFVAFATPSEEIAVTLWAAHTWLVHSSLQTTPRLAVMSTEPGAGKTLVLSLLALLVPQPERIIQPTGPVMFILMGTPPYPTMLFDETDRIWGKAGGNSNAKRELIAILDEGYKRGAMVPRARRDAVAKWPVYGAVAFGGLGALPDTLMDRSVVIRMKRVKRVIEDYDPRLHEQLGRKLGMLLGAWAGSVANAVAEAWPERPEGLLGRQKEIWDPLFAVADVAGGPWPSLARDAAEELALGKHLGPLVSPAVQLMEDIKMVWPEGADKLRSSHLVQLLRDIPGSEYGEVWPDDVTGTREIAAMLPAEIGPVAIKVDGRTYRGYKREQFTEREKSQPEVEVPQPEEGAAAA